VADRIVTLTLRDYQVRLLDDISEALLSYKHVLVQAVTGFGKTVVFSEIARRASAKGSRILILSNRSELLIQSGGSLSRIGIHAEYISPKYRKIPTAPVVIAMAQTLRRRMDKPEVLEYLKSVDLLIIDEAHFADFDFIHESGIFKDKYCISFTATPKRNGKSRQLGLDYEAIVLGERTENLIKQGYLVPARYFTLDAPDLSKVEIDAKEGDYKSGQLFKAFNSPQRYEGLINEYNKICPNTLSLCFCSNQAHAIITCAELNAAGISAKFLVSGYSKDDDNYDLLEEHKHLTGKRTDILAQFARRKFLVLVNAGILVAGYDCPQIETIILNLATLSLTKYLQMMGRGSRVSEGKECFRVLDMGSNFGRDGFGRYEEWRRFSLWHDDRISSGIVPMKICPDDKKDKEGKSGCGRPIPNMSQICPFDDCGFIFLKEKELREIELTEIIDGKFQFKNMTVEQLSAYQELHGFNKYWFFRMVYLGTRDDSEFRKIMRGLGYKWFFAQKLCDQYKSQKAKRWINIKDEKSEHTD